jgi:hypothetical protein
MVVVVVAVIDVGRIGEGADLRSLQSQPIFHSA